MCIMYRSVPERYTLGVNGKVYSMMDLQKGQMKSNGGIGGPGNAEKPKDLGELGILFLQNMDNDLPKWIKLITSFPTKLPFLVDFKDFMNNHWCRLSVW